MKIEKVEPDLYACKVNLPYDCYVIVHGNTRQEAMQAGIEVLMKYGGITEREALEIIDLANLGVNEGRLLQWLQQTRKEKVKWE